MNRIDNGTNDHDMFFAWEMWAVVRRLNKVRFPDSLDTLREVFGESAPPRLPSDGELALRHVDLQVLDRELSLGMDPELFTSALRLHVLDVQSFNDSPTNRENRGEFYMAMATVVDRVETRQRRRR